MAHSYEVMKRQTVAYDYEKVFFNAAFSLGLVGLGWITVKLGQSISGIEEVASRSVDAFTSPDLAAFQLLFDFVEGSRKTETPKYASLAYVVADYRANPDKWNEYKQVQYAAHPEWANTTSTQLSRANQILDTFDKFFTQWGPALPIGVLVGNVGLEYARTWKLKRDLKHG
jgi:hypothetical protein